MGSGAATWWYAPPHGAEHHEHQRACRRQDADLVSREAEGVVEGDNEGEEGGVRSADDEVQRLG